MSRLAITAAALGAMGMLDHREQIPYRVMPRIAPPSEAELAERRRAKDAWIDARRVRELECEKQSQARIAAAEAKRARRNAKRARALQQA